MKQLFLLLFLIPTSYADGQIIPPAPTPKVSIKAKVTPAQAKEGDLICIDARESKGDVSFNHDFLPSRVAIDGKKLYATLPNAEAKHNVTVTFWSEKVRQSLIISVYKPAPPPPDTTTLTTRVTALEKALTSINTSLIQIQKDIADLKKPVPVPDPPEDPFQHELQSYYEIDKKPAVQAAQLASIYKLSGPIVNDPNLKTIQDLYTRMHNSVKILMPDDTLKLTRMVIKNDNDRVFGSKDGTLTPEIRLMFISQHSKIQKALEALK